MATFITAQQVRDYLNITATTGQFSTAIIGSNINAASGFLERRTGRQFTWQGSNVTKTFTTHGLPYKAIPDLIVASTITLQDVELTDGETCWLIPDRQNTGVFTGIQVRPYGFYDYRSNPQWFDRNLDSWLWPYYGRGDLPNDLKITGQWGHVTYPAELLHATMVLAAYYTKRPDAVLSGGIQTPEGGIFDLSRLPVEVGQFIEDWLIGEVIFGS